MDHIIRTVRETDAASILAVYAPYITQTVITFEIKVPTIKEFAARIANITKDYPYLVCEIEGEIVGYAYAAKHRDRSAYKYSVDVSVYVAQGYHHRGIGKALYTRLFEQLGQQNFYTAYAGITLPNEKSVGLHQSFGFYEVGTYRNVGYKNAAWLDVLWLEKPLRAYGIPKEEDR